MIARWQEKEVVSVLRARRVVNLTGVRQCGKTTLADAIDLPKARRFTLDDEETRIAAISDPYGFVERRDGETIVIDEIQKASDTLILDSEKGTRQIDAGCESVRSLEGGFQSIMDSSKATADSSHEILGYVNQMTSSSEQVFVALKQIAQGIDKFSQNTASISAASENVKEVASLL